MNHKYGINQPVYIVDELHVYVLGTTITAIRFHPNGVSYGFTGMGSNDTSNSFAREENVFLDYESAAKALGWGMT